MVLIPEATTQPLASLGTDGFDIKLEVVPVLCRIEACQQLSHGDARSLPPDDNLVVPAVGFYRTVHVP
jgi:hypothetical protein